MVEIAERLATTAERQTLIRGLLEYRALLGRLGYNEGIQLVDGSFVEQVERLRGRPPGDIDVFSFLDLPSLNVQDGALDAQGERDWDAEIIDVDRNKARFGIDSYAVIATDLDFFNLFSVINYWTSLFGHQRRTSAWKGFLLVALDPVSDAAALAHLEQLEAAHA